MNKSVRERERKQFRALILFSVIAYPFWLVYGSWSVNYDALIIVGFMSGWVVWYIKYVKSKVEDQYTDSETSIDWYSISIEEYINIPVLLISLAVVMIACVLMLIAINLFNN